MINLVDYGFIPTMMPEDVSAIPARIMAVNSWTLCKNGGFWSAEPHICLEATHLYENNAVAVDQYVIVMNDGIKEYLTWDTAYTIPKLTDEVSSLGFGVKSVFDDVCGSLYTGEADTMCFILERGAL